MIDRIKSHFAGNVRVVFREGLSDGHAVINTYVDRELVPLATMHPTVIGNKTDEIQIIRHIEATLKLNRAILESELRERIAMIPLQTLQTMLRQAKELKVRRTDGRYSVHAEGSNSDETWTLEQIIRSNPEFSDEDIEKLHGLAVGRFISFSGGAWGEFMICRES